MVTDVEQRAIEAAGKQIYKQPEPAVSEYELGYLEAARVECKLAVIEELERMARAVCHGCREGRVRHLDSGEAYHCGATAHWPCRANDIHARIAEIRVETETKESERGA